MRTKAPHHLLALSSAAVMAIYGAGFLRTRTAAAKFSDAPAMRRPVATLPPAPLLAVDSAPAAETPRETAAAAESPGAAATRESRAAVSPAPVAPAAASTAAPVPSTDQARIAAAASEPTLATDTVAAPAPVAAAPEAQPDATAALTTPATPPAPVVTAKAKYKDGTYLGWGTSRHGDIQAQVVIANDRIVSASIAKCYTQYSCDWISRLPGQVVTRQSAEVDYVSGATQSTNAFYYAVLEALAVAQNR